MFFFKYFCLLFISVIVFGLPTNHTFSHQLSIVHLNDFHARFDQVNLNGGNCKDNQCIGGFSRIYSTIDKIFKEQPDSIVLNGGDNFQGTLWYNIFKWNVTQYFLNKIPFDAIVLGNHEFDDGIKGVVPFIKNLKAPVVISNIDDSLEPDFQGIYNKSVIIERNGLKIGIIGVIIKTTNEISNSENLKFLDESESVNAEAERLVREENVFTNIILSHSGYEVDQQIAAKATTESKIGLIVGGHSHTFLYTGEPIPGSDKPLGPYPTIVAREDGEKVLIVQASCYSKYLGNLAVSYDDNGNYVTHNGAPIYLSSDVPQDVEINKELDIWKDRVNEIGNRILGSSLVTLDQSMCRYSECLLGNFVADAAVFSYISLADTASWTYAALSVFNAGGFRATIESGNITYNDVMTAQPFQNTLDVGDIQGKYIKEMFESCVKSSRNTKAEIDISLLQVSGFNVVFNLSQPIGSRAQSIKIRCNECKIPKYEELDFKKIYRLIVPSFLKKSEGRFSVIANHLKNIQIGRVDMDVFIDYLATKSPVFQEIDNRIKIIDVKKILKKSRK